MKKVYFSPELEVVKIEPMVLSATSPDKDTTDPVEIISDPTDDDFDWNK
jgi:hypothetical protein